MCACSQMNSITLALNINEIKGCLSLWLHFTDKLLNNVLGKYLEGKIGAWF